MTQSKPGQLHPSWQAVIGDELHKPYMVALRDFLKQEKALSKVIFRLAHLFLMHLLTHLLIK